GSDSEIVEHYSRLSREVVEARNVNIQESHLFSKDFQIEKDYENAVTKKYSAKVESLDFSKAEEAAKIIDGFISNVTEGKIHDMVNAESVSGAFSLVVNAIYFTAEWRFKFDKYDNSKQNFFSSETNKREIEFMNDREVTRLYAEDDDFQVLSLPYKDDSYAFNIFLPKKRFGLEEVKKTLDGSRIQNLLSKLHGVYLTVRLFPYNASRFL
ncbi:hypothetical protein OESDEN_24547, partial [Oesophagostomum dentatum]